MNSLVISLDKEFVTSSVNIAETFSKRHDHVLRDIRNLIKKNQSVESMFSEGESQDSYGRKRKTFYMNRDGFTLLTMGFTGKEAIKFKLQYIEAFNKMEEHIKNENKNTIHSYMIEDPIAQAEQWIAEQKLKLNNSSQKGREFIHNTLAKDGIYPQ